MIGHPVEDIETPAIVIDLDVMERNLQNAAAYAHEHGLRLRPHTKTHKIPALGRRQLDLGAAGLTVAKVGEAEVMLGAKPEELLVAYPVIGESKLTRLMEVAAQTRVTVSLDSLDAARALSVAATTKRVEVGVLVEFDAGLHRVGVKAARVAELVEVIAGMSGLRFEGIAFYPGHIKRLDEDARVQIREGSEMLQALVSQLEERWPVPVVSGGSTPTLWHSHEFERLNEIRPGTYIFNDWNTVLCGACTFDDCAATIHTTVVSTAVEGQIIIDGGSKTFSSDRPAVSNEALFGFIPEQPDTRFLRMNEEHGYVRVVDNSKFRVGQRLKVLPVHICVAMNLHEQVYGVRKGRVEEVWRVEGRGKLQ